MKVKEFVEKLQKCNQEKDVLVFHFDELDQWYEPATIKETDHYIYIE